MQVINLLTQLSQTLHTNPSCISMIPWNDLCLCIFNEFQQHKDLYTENTFRKNSATLQTLLENACSSTIAADIISNFEKIALILSFLPDKEELTELVPQLSFHQTSLHHYRTDSLIVLGDSHVNFFSGNEQLTFTSIGHDINTCPLQHSYPITPLHLGPCLAYNCNNPNSSTSFKPKVDYLTQNFIKKGAKLLICLGEIDIRVHVLKQAHEQGVPFEKVVDTILNEYYQFLTELQKQGFQVNVWGPIATQRENCVVNTDFFPRYGTETERNKATAYFTEKLGTFCKVQDLGFYTLFPEMIDEDFHTLSDYLSEDECHLGQAAWPSAYKLLAPLLH